MTDDVRVIPGTSGPAVSDVQRRLGALGFTTAPDEPGWYGDGTRTAIEAFQHRRGLRVDGECGPQTWAALVEAGWSLGDRLLYRRTPMLRGDDVAELQQRLSALGFDAGRVDGIFGDLTLAALAEFQRNAGLPDDGIAGRSTITELRRFGSRHGTSELVSAVRDRELLRRAPRTLRGRRLAIGEEGGLGAALAGLQRILVRQHADVIALHDPDESRQAAEANAADAEVYLCLRLDPSTQQCTSSYYAGFRYTSAGGRRLAELIQATVPTALAISDGGAQGMSLPVLRETRMPAVICELGPPSMVVEHAPLLAQAIADALTAWVRSSWE
ncbi:MAG: peptidoglycan-binding protein [Actinomycetota bacterium]|nr:peptidoglycan-binding protein [Actinomycetota bacterium]MDA8292924.1 peptidoglycan-binding protein [Actinomycetota bacterium]